LIIKVSNNGSYAFAGEGANVSPSTCLKYAFNGFWVLKKQLGRWKIIFNGSDGLRCSLGVPRDLPIPGGCTRGP
jgi:hypothetical protein